MRILFLLHSSALFYEPLGIMYLASTLKRYGHECITCRIDTTSDLASEIKARKADILAVSTTTGMHNRYVKVCNRIREQFDTPVIFGGPHPTFFPEILKEEAIDFICRGEGEFPFLDLVTALEKGEDPTGIRNIDAKTDGVEKRNELRPFLEDLDTLPFPDREVIGEYKIIKKKWKSFMAGRGCPYRCSYCFNHSNTKLADGKYVRKRSVDNLIEEIREARERYGLRIVDFVDDVFIMHEAWLEEFAEKFPGRVGLPFGCNIRANLMNEGICKLLRKAGCVEVGMGVESGNDYLRNELLERGLSRDQILEAARLVRKAGIHLTTQNMIALPGETVEDAMETVELNVKCRPDFSGFSFYQPYPGTKLCEYAMETGMFDGQVDDLPSFFSLKIGTCAGETELAGLMKIVKLYNLVYQVPLLFPLLDYAMGRSGTERTRGLAYKSLQMINILKQLVSLPCGFIYIVCLYLIRGRSRHHHYKWFTRRLAFLWNRFFRLDPFY